MMEGIGEGIADLFIILIVTCAISVPLGIWKLIEIGIWLYHHIHMTVTP